MPLPVRPNSFSQPLGAKRSRAGLGPSDSADSLTAAPPSKKVKVNETEIQTAEIIETLDKKEKHRQELYAKLEEYEAIARERDEWKKKHDDFSITLKEEEINHPRDLYVTKLGQMSPEVLTTINHAVQDKGRGAMGPYGAHGPSAGIPACGEFQKHHT